MAAITALMVVIWLITAVIAAGSPSSGATILRITCDPEIPIYGSDVRLTCEYASWPRMDGGEVEDYHLHWYFEQREIEDYGESSSEIGSSNSKYLVHEIKNTSSVGLVLTIRNIDRSDAGLYTCKTKNHRYSRSFQLQPTNPEMIMMFDRNSSSVVRADDSSTIWCFVRGNPRSKIHWGFLEPVMGGTKKIPSSDYYKTYHVFAHSTSNATYASLRLTLQRLKIEQSGTYYCEADRLNENQPLLYKTLKLDVQGISVTCNSEGKDREVKPGEDKVFSCDIWSNPVIQRKSDVVWQRNGMPINPTDPKFVLDFKNLGQLLVNISLKIKNVQPGDAALYSLGVVTSGMPGTFRQIANITLSVACTCIHPLVCVNKQCVCPQGMRPNPIPTKNKPCIESRPLDDKENFGARDKTTVTHSSVAGVVGGAMGALAVIVIIIIAFVCYRKRKAVTRKEELENPYNPYYQYHSEAVVVRDLPSFDNLGYETQPDKKLAAKENTYTSLSRDRLEFPRHNLQLGVDLGEGRFGKVIQARAMNISGDGKWLAVAVKTCRPSATDSEKQDLYQELEIMKKIPRHVNIVSLLGCCTKADPLYIILEYVQRGSMLSYLRKCRPSSIMSMESRTSSFMQPRAKDLSIFALQVARGMAHLASLGIIHRDLAARNILLDTDFTCKICDFGLARDVEGVDVYERTSKGPLPIRWMAPEALEENCYTRKSDVWSYGVLLWEIVTLGATPYTGMSAMEVMRQVLSGLRLQRPLHCKEEMFELMVRCWMKVPDARPSFADIVTHHEALMNDDYIVLGEFDEDDYTWLDSYTMEERV